MPTVSLFDQALFTTKVRVDPHEAMHFIAWQSKFNATIATFPGFVSLEITSSPEISPTSWTITERFHNRETFTAWYESPERKQLIRDLKTCLINRNIAPNDPPCFVEAQFNEQQKKNVTEVIVTRVKPDQDEAYRKWIAHIHQLEAQFPGFAGTYVQAPRKGERGHWITLLKFDTPEHLDNWLSSPERQKALLEAQPLIETIENHHVISPYAGWFATPLNLEVPPAWKQTMLVLLVLFPIVMLEIYYLSPFISGLPLSIATFIGNALSVSLIAWPMMPLAIQGLRWWLFPKEENRKSTQWKGIGIVLALYLIEIVIFWKWF